MSNMPGEERPSMASVTPYDDNAETLITKVTKVTRAPKGSRVPNQNEVSLGSKNTLATMKIENSKLM
jgi:hypothetical protein